MCFTISKNTKFAVADKDIVCQKIILYNLKRQHYTGLIATDYIYEIGKTYIAAKPLTEKEARKRIKKARIPNFLRKLFNITSNNKLSSEVIYALKITDRTIKVDGEIIETKEELLKLLLYNISPLPLNESVLAEFIIPKGTWYMYNNPNSVIKTIVAPKMKFNRVIP